VRTRGEQGIEQRLVVLKSRGKSQTVEEGIRQRRSDQCDQCDQFNVEEKGGSRNEVGSNSGQMVGGWPASGSLIKF